ncbi:MAG: hypothetical protein WBC11_02165, partial [Dehalococcoidia bacterium]
RYCGTKLKARPKILDTVHSAPPEMTILEQAFNSPQATITSEPGMFSPGKYTCKSQRGRCYS